MARPRTPDRKNPNGSTTVHVQRCCNGCGETIGDVTDDEINATVDGRPLPDVRGECPNCSAVKEGAVVLMAIPQPTDVAVLSVQPVDDGYDCMLFWADRHHDVIASWYATPDTGEDEWLDEADSRLDVARIVKTGHRADGHNRWMIQGGAFLGVTA